MNANKAIGGYFELELSQGEEYHKNAICLNTGRNAFEYILRAKQYKKVYLPYYTCDVMLEPIKKLELDFEFYNIDENFLPIFDFSKVKTLDVFVYTNYYGICDNQTLKVSRKCKNLVVDNSQAFFSKPLVGVDTFYSPRKFFGVPDGAYLYTDIELDIVFDQDISLNRLEHLVGRTEHGAEVFYQKFKENDDSLIGQPIKKMSNLTKQLLQSIDYIDIEKKRIENFLYLHDTLKKYNKFKVEFASGSIPMVYPFLSENGSPLKKILLQNKVYVATYWPNVLDWCDSESLECYFTENILHLPVDQRYKKEDMQRILKLIQRFY